MTHAASARAHPAAPSAFDSAIKVAADAIASQLGAMVAERDAARAGEVEAIHRLRVATRRLRAALRMLREVAPGENLKGATDELTWLCGAIGAVRDLDVLAQLLEERATRLDGDFVRALAPLSGALSGQRAAERQRLAAALDSERYRGLVERLATVAPAPAADAVALGAIAARLVRPPLRATLRAGAGLDETSPPETLHRLRLRVKKLRYALEPMRAAAGGKATRRMLRRLARVQERVGLYHDTVAAIAWLRGWADEARDAPPIAMMAVGALIHSLERRLRRLRRRSLKAWRRSAMDELARATLQELNYAGAEARRAALAPLAPVVEPRAT